MIKHISLFSFHPEQDVFKREREKLRARKAAEAQGGPRSGLGGAKLQSVDTGAPPRTSVAGLAPLDRAAGTQPAGGSVSLGGQKKAPVMSASSSASSVYSNDAEFEPPTSAPAASASATKPHLAASTGAAANAAASQAEQEALRKKLESERAEWVRTPAAHAWPLQRPWDRAYVELRAFLLSFAITLSHLVPLSPHNSLLLLPLAASGEEAQGGGREGAIRSRG